MGKFWEEVIKTSRGEIYLKRVIWIVVCAFCIMLLFTGCNNGKNKDSSLEFSFDSKGYYNGFKNLPANLTIETAERAGYYVTQDLEVIANKGLWDDFTGVSSQKSNTSIRMAKFYKDDDKSPYFVDVFYQDGSYYLFDSSAENLKKQPYKYFLTLKGQFGNPVRDSGVIILTNDNTLTFDTIMASMLSSSMEYIQSVSAYKLVMFL